MSISKKQLAANRKNAGKSTGPNTTNGKARSSLNAVKHGLYARAAVIESPHYTENILEFDHLLGSLYDELKPEGVMQEFLVRKIANCFWRHRRILAAESAQISSQLRDIEIKRQSELKDHRFRKRLFEVEDTGDETENEALTDEELIGILAIPYENFSIRLLRYELRLDRQLSRSFKLLIQLQSLKKRGNMYTKQRLRRKNGQKTPEIDKTNPFSTQNL